MDPPSAPPQTFTDICFARTARAATCCLAAVAAGLHAWMYRRGLAVTGTRRRVMPNRTGAGVGATIAIAATSRIDGRITRQVRYTVSHRICSWIEEVFRWLKRAAPNRGQLDVHAVDGGLRPDPNARAASCCEMAMANPLRNLSDAMALTG